MKKLWLADVDFTVSVVACGEDMKDVRFNFDIEDVWNDMHHLFADVLFTEIKKPEDLPNDWVDQIPYGEDHEKCSEIMEAMKEAWRKKEKEEYLEKHHLKLDLDV